MNIVSLGEVPTETRVAFFHKHWGSSEMVISSGIYDCAALDGFAALNEERVITGLITYVVKDGECEIISLDSLEEKKGIGTALMKEVEKVAAESLCKRITLITTNDNLLALKFYQKRGYMISTIHRYAVEKARKRKPEIPFIGNDGIPIRDEIELEKDVKERMEHRHWPKWAVESIEIDQPNPDWIEEGSAEVRALLQRLSPFGVKEVEHVGSTSIRNLPAKPIIDVMARIPSFDALDEIARSLAEDHWHYVPEELDNRPWRRFFIKVEKDKRVAHLHLMLNGEPRWEQQRLFRDRLNENPSLKEEYAELKKHLAKQFPDDREAYSEGKGAFIQRVLDSQNS